MTDYKQLCAELVDDLELCDWPYKLKETIRSDINRARAALAKPEPEGPTDEELESFLVDVAAEHGDIYWAEPLVLARAVLSRWGNHPEFPDSSTLHPVPVSKCLPGSGDCDAEGRCWWWYPEVPGKTYGYWAYEDDAVPERALNEQPTYWLPAYALPHPS